MSNSITLVSDTEWDPYACLWAEIPTELAGDAARYFIDSPDWVLVREEPDRRTSPNFASIEREGEQPLHFTTSDGDVADAASDALVKLLGRDPDSVH